MKQHIIARVLRVSPSQSELYRRNKSRIFIGVEGESLIDTIVQQSHRNMQDFIGVADRAIIESGLSEGYGELRANADPVLSLFGIGHLTSTNWLQDEDNNVYDLFISIEPTNMDIGEPNVEMIQMRALQNHIEGENPLILSTDVETLMGNFGATDQDQPGVIGQDDDRQPGDQGQVKHPETDGRLKDNGGGQQGQGQVTDPSTDKRLEETGAGDRGQTASGQDDDRQPGGQGRVKDPETDGRLKQNQDGGQRATAAARRPQDGDDDIGQRGRVTSPYDRRLRRNRAAQRRPQDETVTMAASPTWPDGTPRTIGDTKLDGTPRRKPGPAKGSTYMSRSAN